MRSFDVGSFFVEWLSFKEDQSLGIQVWGKNSFRSVLHSSNEIYFRSTDLLMYQYIEARIRGLL